MRRALAAAASPGASLAIALPLPVLVATFCLLWSSAFSVTKLARADCPPLLFLTARFLTAGVVTVGAAAVSGATWCSVTRRDRACRGVPRRVHDLVQGGRACPRHRRGCLYHEYRRSERSCPGLGFHPHRIAKVNCALWGAMRNQRR